MGDIGEKKTLRMPQDAFFDGLVCIDTLGYSRQAGGWIRGELGVI